MKAVCLIDSSSENKNSKGTDINEYQGVYVISRNNCKNGDTGFLGYEIKYIKRNRNNGLFDASEVASIDNIKNGIVLEEIYVSKSLTEVKYLYISWSNIVGKYKFCTGIASRMYYIGQITEENTFDYSRIGRIYKNAEARIDKIMVEEDEDLTIKLKEVASKLSDIYSKYGNDIKVVCGNTEMNCENISDGNNIIKGTFEEFRWEQILNIIKKLDEGVSREEGIRLGYYLYFYINPYYYNSIVDKYKSIVNTELGLEDEERECKRRYHEYKLNNYTGINGVELNCIEFKDAEKLEEKCLEGVEDEQDRIESDEMVHSADARKNIEEDIITEQEIQELFGGVAPNLEQDSIEYQVEIQKCERNKQLKSMLEINRDKVRLEEEIKQRRDAKLFRDAFTDESLDLEEFVDTEKEVTVVPEITEEDTPGEKSCPICRGTGISISRELCIPVVCDCVERKRKRIEARIERTKNIVVEVSTGIEDICVAENLILPSRVRQDFSMSTAIIKLNEYMQNNELAMDKETLKLAKAAMNSTIRDSNGAKRLPVSIILNLPNGIGKTTLANTCIKTIRSRGKKVVPYRSLSEIAKLREEYSLRLLYNNNRPINSEEDFLGFRYKWEDYLTAETVFCFLIEIDKASAQLELSTLKTLVSIRGNNGLPTVVFTDRGIQAYEKNEKLKKFILPDLITRDYKQASLDMLWYITLKTKKKVGIGLQPGKDI